MPKRVTKPPLYPVLPLSGHHVRLLRILPGADDEIIRCKTQVFDLRDEPKYQALSYVCGTMADAPTIELNYRPFQIRKNLWEFLHFLRDMKELDLLWCDQICIDENHLVERNRQVQIMGNIYARSTRALAWVRTIHFPPWKAQALTQQCLDPGLTHRGLGNVDFVEGNLQILWVARELSEAEYWKRVWIVQELISAPDFRVIWNRTHVPPGGVEHLADHLALRHSNMCNILRYARRGDLDTRTRSTRAADVGFRRDGQHSGLLNLMTSFKTSRCSDPRDKVFSLLSVSKEYHQGRRMNVGYSKPAGQVFFETLAFINPRAEDMLEAGRLLVESLELNFDKLWRQTALTTSSLKSDLQDDVRFSCMLPLKGENADLTGAYAIGSNFRRNCGRKADMYQICTVLGGKRDYPLEGLTVFDLGNGGSVIASAVVQDKEYCPDVFESIGIWLTDWMSWTDVGGPGHVLEVRLKKEHLIVALQLEPDLFTATDKESVIASQDMAAKNLQEST